MYTVLYYWNEDGYIGPKHVATIKYLMCTSCDWQCWIPSMWQES